jgi:large subunit ribosomal protein L18
MKQIVLKAVRRRRRKLRVRKRVFGTVERPRLTVFRSHKNIYAQIVDDLAGRTLTAASTMEEPLRSTGAYGGNKAAAAAVGARLAQKAVEAGIKRIVFDRNGYAYHGRVKEVADAARKGGLEF